MAGISAKTIKGYAVLGLILGVLTPFTHGMFGSMIAVILCAHLLRGCFNLHFTSRALWDGRLLRETSYIPLDRAYPAIWFVALGCMTFALSCLPFKSASLIVDIVVVSGIAFALAHLIGRSFVLSRFKRVRTARLRQQYGV